ncbi:MAG: FecR domain-containing protein [Verrucomicrobiota bacterium]
MTDSERQLIDLYLDGALPESEQALLFQRLESDPEALAYLAARTQLNVDLRRSLKRRKLQQQAVVDAVTNVSQYSLKPARSTWLSSPLIAAAALVTVCFAVLRVWTSEMSVYAEMIESQGARWENSTLATEPGSKLGHGQLRLSEGIARLRFARGAEVTLEGPAELELIGPQLCRLSRGSLVAHVPEPAHGFSVLTPNATLIDHGTDFGISTDEKGHANVQVMQGEVELRHANGAPPVRLTTREMASITPEKLLPTKPLEAEPRRSEAELVTATFTTEITTRTGRGAAVYIAEPRTERNQSSTLLLLKHCAEPGYGRKALLRFDLAALPDAALISEAKLTFSLAPSGFGYASHSDDAHIVVYALTEDRADFWNAAEVSWDAQPAFDSSAGRVDESKAVRVGEFIVPRGVQNGAFSIEGSTLVERIKADPNRLLTLILVRENRIEQGGGLVLGIVGNNHPTLQPPTLRVR